MPEVPSDVVELIIAVDLNPSDPEEPINVSNVDVRNKGEGGEGKDGEDWKSLTMQLLMADPKAEVTSDSISYDEAVKAAARVMETADRDESPFERAKSRSEPQDKPERPRYGNDRPAEKPDFKPRFDDRDEEPRRGGMKSALNRALGRKDDEDEEDF